MEILSVIVFLFFYMYASEIPKVYRYSCYYWLPVAMVLLSFSLQKGTLSRALNNRLLIMGGEISYSFYLIHLLVLLPYADWKKTTDLQIAWWVSVPVLLCVILWLSVLSYRYFEKSMNKKIKLLLDN